MNQELLHKYFKGETSIQEEQRIIDWVEASEENRQWYLKERMLFDVALFTQERKLSRTQFTNRVLPALKWSARIAAVLIVIVSATYFLKEYQYNKVEQLQNVAVPAGQRAQITLADGTKIWLNAKSTLTYASNFGRNDRNVVLDGEAYFEVSPNKDIPFYVHTEHNQIKVVGTSFNVCAYKGTNEFNTTLVEGIVDIYKADGQQRLVRLTKDEIFSSKYGKYSKSMLTSYDYLRWKEGLYCFDDTPFKEVLERVEKYYSITISVQNPAVLDYHCTGKFRDKDGVEHILKTIRKDHKFTYRFNADRDSITIE